VPAWLLTNGTIRNFADTTKNYVEFGTASPGNYYLVVRHRNHLAIMDSAAQTINRSANPPVYDFTTRLGRAYSTDYVLKRPMAAVRASFAMFAGDANGNGTVSFSGGSNDRSAILSVIGLSNLSNVVSNVYNNADLNLNGSVSYSGSANDRNVILTTVGLSNMANTLVTQVP
jgi:hypothetical protein